MGKFFRGGFQPVELLRVDFEGHPGHLGFERGGGEGIGDREAVSLADLPDFCCREGAD